MHIKIIRWFQVGLFVVVLAMYGSLQQLNASTESMKKLLATLAGKANPIRSTYLSDARVRMFQIQLQRAKSDKDRVALLNHYAEELLNAGQSDEALKQFNLWETLAEKTKPELYAANRQLLMQLKALCHLRIGEQENCLHNHTTESCLLPIRGSGVHQLSRGSEGAIQQLEGILREFPKDLSSKWLLNIAYMTLGRHPHDVPKPWLIPASVFESPYDIGRFKDAAGGLGVDVNALSGGTILDDFNGDGWLDIMVSSWGLRDPMHCFINRGNGTFEDQSKHAGLEGITSGLNMLQADYDNDGDVDILVLRGAWLGSEGRLPNSLLKNDGTGRFKDVTEESGLLSFHPTQTAVWWDYNGDGWLDLFIGNESYERERHSCELYRNNQDGTFTECARENGLSFRGYVKGTAAADIDNDGYMDLFVSVQMGPNKLFRNLGPSKEKGGSWKFEEIGTKAGVREPIHSFPCWFFDYNNDGWQDLFIAGYNINGVGDVAADYLELPHNASKAKLYRNRGDGTFTDESKTLGLDKVLHAMGCNYGDLDNDGYLDFYVGTGEPNLGTLIPNRMFRNNEAKRFQEVTTSGGFGHLQKGHGVGFADLDHDGDQDVYANMGGAVTGDVYRNALFENPGHSNRWLKLNFHGVDSNRKGVGSRLKIVVNDEAGTQRTIHRVIRSGGSFGSSPLRLEVGLGKAVSIDSIIIQWHGSGTVQNFSDVPLDQCISITENKHQFEIVPLKSFHFKSMSNHHH
ncbi:MAG: CRTAC1 family protein [Verrucomicrobia bacterium]|jgi:hypothetical protein|nr:CRTAC1 family protein [Verrucomicrobiota bacterium]